PSCSRRSSKPVDMTNLHLDDEALSAALDGEATAAEQSHLVSCPVCRQRVDVFRTVALAVARQEPPHPPAAETTGVAPDGGSIDVVEPGNLAAPRDASRRRRVSRILSIAAVAVV